jgi:hypothetical protein
MADYAYKEIVETRRLSVRINDLNIVWLDWQTSLFGFFEDILKSVPPRTANLLVHDHGTVFSKFFPQPNLNPASGIFLRQDARL